MKMKQERLAQKSAAPPQVDKNKPSIFKSRRRPVAHTGQGSAKVKKGLRA